MEDVPKKKDRDINKKKNKNKGNNKDKDENYKINMKDANIINRTYQTFFNIDIQKIKKSNDYNKLINILYSNNFWHLINCSYFFPNKLKYLEKLQKIFNVNIKDNDVNSDIDSISSLNSIKSDNIHWNMKSNNNLKFEFENINNDFKSLSNYNSENEDNISLNNQSDSFLITEKKTADNNFNVPKIEDIYMDIKKPQFFSINLNDNNNIDLLKKKLIKYIKIFREINSKNLKFLKEKSEPDLESDENSHDDINYTQYIDENLIYKSNKKSTKIHNIFVEYLKKKELNKINDGINMDGEQCCICNGFEFRADNYLYECLKCKIIVHKLCYGIFEIDNSNDFICDKCKYIPENKNKENENFHCLFCPNKNGAFKLIDISTSNIMSNKKFKKFINDNALINNEELEKNSTKKKFALVHINCVLFNQCLEYEDINTRNTLKIKEKFILDSLNVNKCSICNKEDGLLIKCHQEFCDDIFHPECAVQSNFFLEFKYMKNFQYFIFCKNHTKNINIFCSKINNINNFNIGEIINFYKIYSSICDNLKVKNSRYNIKKRSSVNKFKNILKQHNSDNIDCNNSTESKNEEGLNNIENKSYDFLLNDKNPLINSIEPTDKIYKFIIKKLIIKIIEYYDNNRDETIKGYANNNMDNNIANHPIYFVKLKDLFKEPLKSIIQNENITMNMVKYIFKTEKDFNEKFIQNIKFNLNNKK